MTTIFNVPRALVAALVLCGISTALRADCGASEAGSKPDAALEVVSIPGSAQDIGGGRYLGLLGERVEADMFDFDTDLRVTEGKVAVAQPWPERVDWSVYVKSGVKLPGVRFYFDRRADNSRRLCRVAEMVWEDTDEGEPTGRLMARETWIFRYQASGRLEQVLNLGGWAEADRVSSYCYLYDAEGRPAGRVSVSDDHCAGAKLIEAPFIYVHALDGQLLRVISDVPLATTQTRPPVEQRERVVQTFDSKGNQVNVYAKDSGGYPYRVTYQPPKEDGENDEDQHVSHASALVMDQENWQVILIDPDGAKKGNSVSWRFVRLKPEYLGTDMETSESAVVEIIAKGKTDRTGATTLTRAQQRKLFARMKQHPAQVMLRCADQGITGLMMVPGISKAQWDACTDPMQRDAKACE